MLFRSHRLLSTDRHARRWRVYGRSCGGCHLSFCKPRLGAIASQSFANPYLGIDGLALLEQGHTAQSAVARRIADDPGRARRQLSVVDKAGNAATFTGQDCLPWCGEQSGQGYAVAANMMVDATTVEAMVESFETSRDEALPERLLKALEAGAAPGGAYRGRESAALLV